MFKLELIVPMTLDDTGWNFPTKNEAESFLKHIGYNKVSSMEDTWVGGLEMMGGKIWHPVIHIKETEEDWNEYFNQNVETFKDRSET